jgi:transcriptional regulator with XRE-family HTH domain
MLSSTEKARASASRRLADRGPVGLLLREWRARRNLSQLDLAARSAVSARHLSFIETGRARPSREMVLHLAERLRVPERERNRMLLAAGYAPVFGQWSLDDDEMAPVSEALDRFLAGHEPYPAIVVDRLRNLIAANRAVEVLTADVAPELLEPPANVLRIQLHPDGLAPQIVNFDEWSGHVLWHLRRDIAVGGDRELEELYAELAGYPHVNARREALEVPSAADIVLPLRLRRREGDLSFFSTMAAFGTALDVTLAELAIEAFYPADRETSAALREHGESRKSQAGSPTS